MDYNAEFQANNDGLQGILDKVNALPESGKIPDTAVLYTKQNLTEEQKAQARENIGVNTSGGLSITDDGEGNVSITSSGAVTITDDGKGNVVIA